MQQAEAMWVGILLAVSPVQPLYVWNCDIVYTSLGQEIKKILVLRWRYLKDKQDNNQMRIHL